MDSTHTTELLSRAENGCPDAFRLLVERHLPAVREAVRKRLRPRIRSRVDNSDIVQEAQKQAFQSLPDFLTRRPMPFRLWLLKTAHERILTAERVHIHAAKRSVEREMPLPDESSLQLACHFGSTNPATKASQRELTQIVRRCVADLGDIDREILVLRCFNNLSNQEVATILEVNPETSKKRFTRAVLRLKDRLEAAGVSEESP